MKILVWHGKYGDTYLDATDEDKAFLALFSFVDKQLRYYDVPGTLDGDQITALDLARGGDPNGAKWLLEIRSEYEYEGWSIETPVGPDEQDKWIAEEKAPF